MPKFKFTLVNKNNSVKDFCTMYADSIYSAVKLFSTIAFAYGFDLLEWETVSVERIG